MFYLLSGKDVFVNLPTGFGKSLIYQLTPLVAEAGCPGIMAIFELASCW